jgi:hypothetical protein
MHDSPPSQQYLAIDTPNQPRGSAAVALRAHTFPSRFKMSAHDENEIDALLDTLYNSLSAQRTGKHIKHN